MREIDLSKFKIRTDLVADIITNEQMNSKVKEEKIINKNCTISRINLDIENAKKINKKPGMYTTIFFDDITDKTNYQNILENFIKELKNILTKTNIKEEYTCLVVGLGNEKSTPDSLGPKVINNINVTRHIYELVGNLEKGYRIVSSFIPGVMASTGIETSDIIMSLTNKIKPDFLIIIDALASDTIDRVLKTIQISNTGINPGSGVGNHRKELSEEVLNIPTIAIGVPTVVDAVTIVSDTINYMLQHFSYSIKNKDNPIDKLIPSYKRNFLNKENLKLNKEQTNYFLGAFGNLSNFEQKALIFDVLTPIGYNLMVTPKEIDFIIDKLTNLVSEGINKSIHNI